MSEIQRYGAIFINGEGEELDFAAAFGLTPASGVESLINVQGRRGDWGSQPFETLLDTTLGGGHAVATSVRLNRGEILWDAGIDLPAGYRLWDVADAISTILRPLLDEVTPNVGWFHFPRLTQVGTPDEWRIAAAPRPWLGWQETERGDLMRFRTTFAFAALGPWQKVPETETTLRLASASSWGASPGLDVSITPGGDAPCYPVWELDGPSSGTITSVSLTHANGDTFALSGIALGAGQTLTITTEPFRWAADIDGVDVYRYRSATSRFFPLTPAANTVTIVKNANSQSAVRVRYRARRWGL